MFPFQELALLKMDTTVQNLKDFIQCLAPKMNADQSLPWLVMVMTVRYGIGNPKLLIPPENTIALRSLLPFLQGAFTFLEQETFNFW